MDLIYTNAQREEMGILPHPSLDLAFGSDENDFELTLKLADHCMEKDCFFYADCTEYGGIVDATEVDSAEDTITYSGRTWHGILASKVILPDASGDAVTGVTVTAEDAALVISGDANACLRWLCKRIGLDGLFTVPTEAAGVTVNRYAFEPYCDAYSGICGMLGAADLRLAITATYNAFALAAVTRYDYSVDQEFESDLIEYWMRKHYNVPNHLVCLGAGAGADRIVVHLYADADGNISETQTYTGLAEIVAVMDNSGELTEADAGSVDETVWETLEASGKVGEGTTETVKIVTAEQAAEEREEKRADLVERGTEQLKELRELDEIEVDFTADDDRYYIGDLVGAYENLTELSTVAAVTKKIVTIKNGKTYISYKVG